MFVTINRKYSVKFSLNVIYLLLAILSLQYNEFRLYSKARTFSYLDK